LLGALIGLSSLDKKITKNFYPIKYKMYLSFFLLVHNLLS